MDIRLRLFGGPTIERGLDHGDERRRGGSVSETKRERRRRHREREEERRRRKREDGLLDYEFMIIRVLFTKGIYAILDVINLCIHI